jgi:hypothetical protein
MSLTRLATGCRASATKSGCSSGRYQRMVAAASCHWKPPVGRGLGAVQSGHDGSRHRSRRTPRIRTGVRLVRPSPATAGAAPVAQRIPGSQTGRVPTVAPAVRSVSAARWRAPNLQAAGAIRANRRTARPSTDHARRREHPRRAPPQWRALSYLSPDGLIPRSSPWRHRYPQPAPCRHDRAATWRPCLPRWGRSGGENHLQRQRRGRLDQPAALVDGTGRRPAGVDSHQVGVSAAPPARET